MKSPSLGEFHSLYVVQLSSYFIPSLSSILYSMIWLIVILLLSCVSILCCHWQCWLSSLNKQTNMSYMYHLSSAHNLKEQTSKTEANTARVDQKQTNKQHDPVITFTLLISVYTLLSDLETHKW